MTEEGRSNDFLARFAPDVLYGTIRVAVLLLLGFLARRLGGAGVLSSLWSGATVALLGYVVVQIELWTRYLPNIDL